MLVLSSFTSVLELPELESALWLEPLDVGLLPQPDSSPTSSANTTVIVMVFLIFIRSFSLYPVGLQVHYV